jgi:hypothetical protein
MFPVRGSSSGPTVTCAPASSSRPFGTALRRAFSDGAPRRGLAPERRALRASAARGRARAPFPPALPSPPRGRRRRRGRRGRGVARARRRRRHPRRDPVARGRRRRRDARGAPRPERPPRVRHGGPARGDGRGVRPHERPRRPPDHAGPVRLPPGGGGRGERQGARRPRRVRRQAQVGTIRANRRERLRVERRQSPPLQGALRSTSRAEWKPTERASERTDRTIPSEQAETCARVLVLVRALALEVSRKTNNRS